MIIFYKIKNIIYIIIKKLLKSKSNLFLKMKQKIDLSDISSTKLALMELYTTIRQYSFDEKDIKKDDLNIEYLSSLDDLELIKYITDSMDVAVLTLAEKKIDEYNKKITCSNIQQDYEAMLVKYEQDIRGHIKVEHQLKLYSDSLQSNIEELEKEKNSGFNKDNKQYQDEIKKLKNEIKSQQKIIKSYEEKNIKSTENEKKLKSIIAKNEKKYKEDIDNLNKKLNTYIEKIQLLYNEKNEKKEKKKSENIFCNSSRRSNNSNFIKNLYINDNGNQNINNSLHNIGRIFRNSNNSISINDNHSTSMTNSRHYAKLDKYILNKYIKNSQKASYQNKINIKNNNAIYNNISIPNNNNNSSYILDQKAQDEIINKFMLNDSVLNNKKITNRHKSVGNDSSKYIKEKNLRKLLMQNNNNSNRNSVKNINKGTYNRNIINKKFPHNLSDSVKNVKNFMSKTAKEININNIIENKNNIGCNFVNNINIFSNNLKQDNSNNIYLGNNFKKFTENATFRAMAKHNNGVNDFNYIKLNGSKNTNIISNRNKQNEGKNVSSSTNSMQRKYN